MRRVPRASAGIIAKPTLLPPKPWHNPGTGEAPRGRGWKKMKARPGKGTGITDGIVDRLGGKRDRSRAERILKNGRRERAGNVDAFSPVTVFFPRSNWASIIRGSATGTQDKWEEKEIGERERKSSPASTGYAGELKSLHAPTVMYGDCACVTRLALRSVIRPFFLAAPRRHADNHPLLSRYRNGHRYLFYTRMHAAAVNGDKILISIIRCDVKLIQFYLESILRSSSTQLIFFV